MSRESKKGAEFEQQVADYLAAVLGDRRIERRVKNGRNDRGDISGVFIRKLPAVIECKNHKRMDLPTWLEEVEIERGNDDAEFAIVVHKRKGCGEKKFGENYTTMTLETLAAIIAGAHDCLEER